MLITVDQVGILRGAEEQPRAPRPPQGVPVALRAPLKLWAVTAILAMLSSMVAMSRIGVLPFAIGLGLGAPKAAADIAPLPHSLPYGKGMWMWQPERSDGGDVHTMISRAKSVGLTHIYVRTGSSWDGFYAGPFLDKLLPAAHAAGMRVYGWDFPQLIDPAGDAARAMQAITYTTPSQQRLDGFAADIETPSEGTHISAETAVAYGDALRGGVGDGYPLIACVPRPSPWTMSFYPYWDVVARFDAIAPMVYWLNRQPDTDVAGALADLAPLGKPVFPVGQAFDGGPEGGRPGAPTVDELQRFLRVAKEDGAQGVSFWSWQAASQDNWDTIRDAPEFTTAIKPLEKAPVTTKPARRYPMAIEAG